MSFCFVLCDSAQLNQGHLFEAAHWNLVGSISGYVTENIVDFSSLIICQSPQQGGLEYFETFPNLWLNVSRSRLVQAATAAVRSLLNRLCHD